MTEPLWSDQTPKNAGNYWYAPKQFHGLVSLLYVYEDLDGKLAILNDGGDTVLTDMHTGWWAKAEIPPHQSNFVDANT